MPFSESNSGMATLELFDKLFQRVSSRRKPRYTLAFGDPDLAFSITDCIYNDGPDHLHMSQ
jgi:hypothetical protein